MSTQDDIAELKALVREAHAATRDLREEIKAAGKVALELRDVVEAEANKQVDRVMASEIQRGLAAMTVAFDDITTKSTEAIKARFARVDSQLAEMLRAGEAAKARRPDLFPEADKPTLDFGPDLMKYLEPEPPEPHRHNREDRRRARKRGRR